MPFYEYQCTACGHRLETLQKISAPPLQDCPHCHHSTLKKLISKSAFRLKGNGWYETDFKHSGTKDKPKPDQPTDTKPATPTDSPSKPTTPPKPTTPTSSPTDPT